MECKYCGAPLVEGFSFCPACGKNNADEEPTPVETPEESIVTEPSPPEQPQRSSGGMIAAVIAGCLLSLALLAAGIFYIINGGWSLQPQETLPPETTAPTAPTYVSYTADDATVVANRDKVVATIDSQELTGGELQIYYWMQFYDFLDYYGGYIGYYIDLDYTAPLDTQLMEEGITWQEFFLESGLETWHRYAALSNLAKKANYVMEADYQQYLDNLPNSLHEMALENGYADANEMLHAEMGAGSSVEDYVSYLSTYYYGFQYYMDWYESLDPSATEIEAYYTEHAEELTEAGITKDGALLSDVRHILIAVEGETPTEAAWIDCQIKAQAILDQWLAGEATEDSFAALANEHSEDPGSNTSGGLYTDVEQGEMVAEFDSWCFDPARQYGDYGLVKTDYGYHIMFFVDCEEAWLRYTRQEMLYNLSNEMIESATAQYPITVNYDNVYLGLVTFD